MKLPRLLRRRFIPDELIDLRGDTIVTVTEDVIVTKWYPLKPRPDFCRGASCYFIKEGFKVSRFFDGRGDCIYIYCDIVETIHDPAENTYTFNDLLLDAVILNDGFVKVLDTAELGFALDSGLIGPAQASAALKSLGALLDIIYGGGLGTLTRYLDEI